MRITMAVLGVLLVAGCASRQVDTKVTKEDLIGVNGWKCSATVISGVRVKYREHVIYRENGSFDKQSHIDIKVPDRANLYKLVITSEGQWDYGNNTLKEYLAEYRLEPGNNIPENELKAIKQELEIPETGIWRVFRTSEKTIKKRTRLSQSVTCEKVVY